MAIRKEIYQDGILIETIDNRVFADEKEAKLAQLKINVSKYIYTQVPLEKQINASLGILSLADSLAIKNIISQGISNYEGVKNEINSCNSLNELDAININV